MAARKAFITGITGQDGSYLAELLLEKGYEVHGLVRRSSSFNTWRIDHVRDRLDPALRRPRRPEQPGAHPGAGRARRGLQPGRPEPRQGLLRDAGVHGRRHRPGRAAPARRRARAGPARRASTRRAAPRCSASCRRRRRREKTPFHPRSPYGVAKVFGHWMAVNYREGYGMHVSNGILFNHESPRRGENFVTRKITMGVAAIKKGRAKELRLGNLDAKRDWGFARDYVEAMWLMLQQEQPGRLRRGHGRDALGARVPRGGLLLRRPRLAGLREGRPEVLPARGGGPAAGRSRQGRSACWAGSRAWASRSWCA